MNESGPDRSGVEGGLHSLDRICCPAASLASRTFLAHRRSPALLLSTATSALLTPPYLALRQPVTPPLPWTARPGCLWQSSSSGLEEWTTALALHRSRCSHHRPPPPPLAALSAPQPPSRPWPSPLLRFSMAGFGVGRFPGLALVGPRSAPPRALAGHSRPILLPPPPPSLLVHAPAHHLLQLHHRCCLTAVIYPAVKYPAVIYTAVIYCRKLPIL